MPWGAVLNFWGMCLGPTRPQIFSSCSLKSIKCQGMTSLLHPASELLLSPEVLPNTSVIRRMLRHEDAENSGEEEGNCLSTLAIPAQGAGMREGGELVISQVKENLVQGSISSLQLTEIEGIKKICTSPDFRRANVEETTWWLSMGTRAILLIN